MELRDNRKILVMGLPGAGKTALSTVLAPKLGAVRFNADEVRANINKDLGFSPDDRIEHARRMGWLCDRVVEAGGVAIADFVCPTPQTRAAFGDAFVIWVDRIAEGRFADTNKLFQPPESYDIRVTVEDSPAIWAERIVSALRRRDDARRFAWMRSPRAACAALFRSGLSSAVGYPVGALAIVAATLVLRAFLDPAPLGLVDGSLQFGALLAAAYLEGAAATLITWLLSTCFAYFCIAPIGDIRIVDWIGMVEFGAGSALAALLAVLIMRDGRQPPKSDAKI
jgi:adenylate kinase family enzyme